jgi:beta-galactosidase/beta-glucuronidase
VSNEINDATRTWAYTFRSMETLNRDKNRACVVAWSCGNESGYGVNNQAEFDYAKAHDSTRLALISQQNLDRNPKSDFEDFHIYPTPILTGRQGLLVLATNANRAKCPVILTEYGAGNDQQLNTTWNAIWSNDALVGAFIWEWQAQGMYDKFPERWAVPSPGARNNATNGYRASGGNGPVTADRQITPMFYRLKAVHSPVNAVTSDVAPAVAANQDWRSQCTVPIQNRYSFTDLGELTCHYQLLAGGKILASGEGHIAAKPRSTVEANFPLVSGMDTLRLEFIHPDGRTVYTTNLSIKN